MAHSKGEERLKGDEEESLASPATTPGSVVDEEKFLVAPYNSCRARAICFKKSTKKWICSKDSIPMALLTVSLVEILVYFTYNESLMKLLRFDPVRLHELWRFITYMFVHEDLLHLVLNVAMQLLFASFLEHRHGRMNVLILYLAGGSTGVLGASCLHPDMVIGASAGVYALLISNVADLMMNYESMSYKLYRFFCIVVIVVSDVTFNVVHIFSRDEPLISWGAHITGGISGLFLGLILFKRDEHLAKHRKRTLFWLGVITYLILMISLVILTMQIKKCTPSNVIHTRYVYFC